MSHVSFSPTWATKFSDPYAVLGLSVTADERRVQKRYRAVARLLHPDTYVNCDPEVREIATQILARLVNPAYQKVRQDVGRNENLALLRVKARRVFQQENIQPTGASAIHLMSLPVSAIDVFYEQAVTQLADHQYASLDQFAIATEQLVELNLVYLWRRIGEPIRKQPGPGIIPVPPPRPPEPQKRNEDYAEKHYRRAQEYVQKETWAPAARELKDAIQLVPTRSEYHALLGKVYLNQNLPGMAQVYIKQALKLNPGDRLAREYAARLRMRLDLSVPESPQNPPKSSGGGGLLRMFARSRR